MQVSEVLVKNGSVAVVVPLGGEALIFAQVEEVDAGWI